MSRSFRRYPFAAYCGRSQKRDKRYCNRSMRRRNRIETLRTEPSFVRARETSNVYWWSQDGSRHYAPFDPCVLDYRRWYKWAKAK